MTTDISLPRGEIIQQMDGTYELFPVPPEQDTLLAIIKDCLKEWEHIRIGPLIPGEQKRPAGRGETSADRSG